MNELLERLRELYFKRRKNLRILKMMMRETDPRTEYSPTDEELVTLVILDVSTALRETKNDLNVVFERIYGIMDKRANVASFYELFIITRDRIAVVFCGNEADRKRVVSGAVKEYSATYPAENELEAVIIFGFANDLEAVHMCMRMRRKYKEEKEEFDRDLAGSIGKMLIEISTRKLWAVSLMHSFLAVAEATKDTRWNSWYEVRHRAGANRIPESVQAVIHPTDIRTLSGLPLERQAAYVYELFERSVQEELTGLLEKQASINRDDRFRLYALQLVIEQDRILIGQDSASAF